MPIIGIETLSYGVENVGESVRFFEDFGLKVVESDPSFTRFQLPEGSYVEIRALTEFGVECELVGPGVREVIWGVDNQATLDRIADRLSAIIPVQRDPDGTVHFVPDFGIPMGLRVFNRQPVVTAPDLANAPGHIVRFNRPRRWRERAMPKVISHVVFAVPRYREAFAFMRDHLNFRLSDYQCGFGMYLRCDGSNNHHNLLFLNANAKLPDMDGKTRFHHANFGVEDIDELMIGANHMTRQGWPPSHLGFGRHRVDSALFYYLPCPTGGEAEYGTDSDYIDDTWVPRQWTEPLFGYAHFVHDLPDFLATCPPWNFEYLTQDKMVALEEND